MKIVEQSHQILNISPELLQIIELAGRTCYKSEEKITATSAEMFVNMLVRRGHHAMIEFGDITVKFITNRGVTHELVRHRLCSFAQESTRYVNYGGTDIQFIKPIWLDSSNEHARNTWLNSMADAEVDYQNLLMDGWRPEQAREVLPNSLKTEICVKANVREWRHIFALRVAPQAHPQMRALMIPLLDELKERVPVIFGDF